MAPKRTTVGRLTNGEQLFLRRRREGLTQVEAATAHNVSRALYSLAERDLSNEVRPTKPLPTGELLGHEKCVILRRRAGLTQQDVAAQLGVCRRTMMLMELNVISAEPLVEHWGA